MKKYIALITLMISASVLGHEITIINGLDENINVTVQLVACKNKSIKIPKKSKATVGTKACCIGKISFTDAKNKSHSLKLGLFCKNGTFKITKNKIEQLKGMKLWAEK